MSASAYHITISTEITALNKIWIFRHLCISKQSTLIFLCKYYMVISDTLVGSFLDAFFFLIHCNIIRALWETIRRKDWVAEKSTKKNFWERYHFPDSTPSFLCLFVAFFICSSPFRSDLLLGILCDNVTSERSKIWKSPTI